MPLIPGQSEGEIEVPTGVEGVVLVARAVAVEIAIFDMESGEKETLSEGRGRSVAENDGAVTVRRVAGTDVEFSVGNGTRIETFVAFLDGKGRREEAVMFKKGGFKRPDVDALNFVVKFTVGNGKKPDAGKVEFAVELAVGRGKMPDLGKVEFAVKLAVGRGSRPDLGMVEFTVKFTGDEGKKPPLGRVGKGGKL